MTEQHLQAFEAEIGFWRKELDRRAVLLEQPLDPVMAERFQARASELRSRLRQGDGIEPADALQELSSVVIEAFGKKRRRLGKAIRA